MASHQCCVAPQASEVPGLIDWLRSCCRVDGVADALALRVALALEEAVINVITYGFAELPPPHRIAVRLDIGADALAVEIVDNGRAFDPTRAPGPDLSLPLAERDPGGLGIHLMRNMVDHIVYRRRDGSNILRLEKSRR